ncbi:MAG: DUF2141 domain-containing protein [candidate division NC10 bacterium]|nr:DUF2141 domain-containing protein [candidate division NC10 bacterium]MDE2322424.1 DUF2141 domain-containing protein [candidate division NC10 bacterium]
MADALLERYGGMTSSFVGLGLACLLLLSWSGEVHARAHAIERVCDSNSAAIEVRVHGVRNDRGNIMFILYGDNPDDFLAKGKTILKQRTPAKRGTVAFCVIVPKAGMYAAAVYHDENANGKFDRNWIGLPGEGGGFSNNPTQFLVIPSHSQVAFHVSNSQTRLEIQLIYPTASEH